MEELQDSSIHHMTAKLIAAIKNTKCYEPIYNELQRLVASPSVDKNDMRNTLEDAIKAAGLETEIRNMIFNLVRSRLKKIEVPDARLTPVSARELRELEHFYLKYFFSFYLEIVTERSVELPEACWRPVGSPCAKESKRHVWRTESAAAWPAAH